MRTEALSLSEHTINSSVYQPMHSMKHIICHLQTMLLHEKVGLVTITLEFAQEKGNSSSHQYKVVQSTQYLLENLRSRVRKTDTFLLLERTCYIVLRGANQQGAAIVQERTWEALLWAVHNLNEQEYVRPSAMAIGYGAYPELHTTLEHCLRAALEPAQRFVREKNIHKMQSSSASQRDIQRDDLPLFARQLGIPYLPKLPRNLSKRILGLIDRQLAQELHCIPLGREHDTLTVAMSDPQNQQTLERLKQATGLEIFPILTDPQELQKVLEEQ